MTQYIKGRPQNRRLCRSQNAPDWAAVQRAVNGDLALILTPGERAQAIDQLDHWGWSAAQVATRLGTTIRTVQRWRARRRAATGGGSE